MPFTKYKNPDPKCIYPFTNDPVGYCWSMACHVDYLDLLTRKSSDKHFADLSKICINCPLWKDSPNFDPNSV